MSEGELIKEGVNKAKQMKEEEKPSHNHFNIDR